MEVRLATTYTTAIAALTRCGAWKEALELVKQADKEGLDPSPALYHAAMFACTKGQPTAKWTECLDLLREMKAKGLPVGATAYNTAILCAGMAHEVRLSHGDMVKELITVSPLTLILCWCI
jgi:pentatricopeptide repeat protein